MKHLAAWILGVAFLLSATARAAGGELHASLEVIVDQSETMSSTADNRSLFQRVVEAARNAVDAQAKAPGTSAVNWRTTGGGAPPEDAACEATKLVAPAGISASPVLAALARERARGPRPLSGALEASVADFPKEGSQHGLLIVTSGADTCGRDVCLTASDLRSSQPFGNVRVLLVGTDSGAAARLSCLGTVTPIRDVGEVEKKIREAMDALDHPARVSVTALDGGHDVRADVELYAGQDTQPVVTGRTGQPLSVLAGSYQVHVVRPHGQDDSEAGRPREGWRRNLEVVPDAELVIRVPVGKEEAHLVANVQFNGAPAPLGTRVAVLHSGDTEDPVITGSPGETLTLPGGHYDVRASIPGGPLDAIEVWKPDVIVRAGDNVTVTLAGAQRRGTLQVDLFSNGQPTTNGEVILVQAGAHEESNAVFTPGRALTLPMGTYKVIGRLDTIMGKVTVAQDNVVVAPDAPASVHLDLPPLAQISVEVADYTPADGIVVGIARAGEDTPAGQVEAFSEATVPIGTYDLRIEVHSSGTPVTFWHRGVKVRAGDHRVVKVKVPR